MLVVLPFALPDGERLQPWALSAAKLALRQDGWKVDARFMAKDDSYYELLCEYWAKGEDFCVVEHDIVVWPGALSEMEACREPWCTRPYYCSVGWILDGLGCARFSGTFTRLHPEFLKPPFPTCCQHTTYYCGLDRLVAHRMQELGLKPHVHNPGVVNLNQKWT